MARLSKSRALTELEQVLNIILNKILGNLVRTMIVSVKNSLLLPYFPYFEKNESMLMRSPCCLHTPPPPQQLLNARTSVYETWYVL
jgi:hypothetical protein